MPARRPREPKSPDDCEAGDIIQVRIDGKERQVILGWKTSGAWFVRDAELASGRVNSLSEPWELPSSAEFLGRLSGRERYASAAVADYQEDPLLNRL